MKLYTDKAGTAPSPRRVRIYLAEKGIEVPFEYVDLSVRETRSPEFKRKNRLGNVPVLELDDGTCLAESMAICRYLEELYPEPPLFGSSPLERAQIEMWLRRLEFRLYLATDLIAAFADLPEAAARCRETALRSFRSLDDELADRPFIAGHHFSMADVFALGTIDYGMRSLGLEIAPELKHLRRWHDLVSARPSARV